MIRLSIALCLAVITPKGYAAEGAGTVAKVQGKVQALRNPRPAPTGGLSTQAKFKDAYWDTYDLAAGSPLFLGDLLSASAEGRTQLTLEAGFTLILAPNAKLRLSKTLVQGSKPKTVVDLMVGSLRARSRPGTDEDVEFRSRTLVLGVRGTDFSITALPRETQVVVVDGEVVLSSNLTDDAAKTVLTAGQATSLAAPPEDFDLAALRESMTPEAFSVMAKAYDPEPPRPASAAQARQIRDFSEGLAEQRDQQDIESLIAKTDAADVVPQTPPSPSDAAPESSRRRAAIEVSLASRSVGNEEPPQLEVHGLETRIAADYEFFASPLALGVSVASVTLGPSAAFDDGDLDVDHATEASLGLYGRYPWQFLESHAVFFRLGLRIATLETSGTARDGSKHATTYDTGGLELGCGYEWRIAPWMAVAAQLALLPGSIESEDDPPFDRDITKNPDGNAWGGASVGVAARIQAF